MATPRRVDPRTVPEASQLRVLSLKPGERQVVRIRDNVKDGVVLGCFTHWAKKTVYCRGTECPITLHRSPLTWYGFLDGDFWDENVKRWMRTVIQVTESLEQDFRYRIARGQMWEIFRDDKVEGRNPPWQGRLIMEEIPDQLGEPFPVVNQLMHTLHTLDVRLQYPNPLPPREIVSYVEGFAPPLMPDPAKQPPKPDPEAKKKFDEWRAKRGPRYNPELPKPGKEEANGTHTAGKEGGN